MGMASSIVNSIEAKAVKQRGHKNVTETNAMQAVRFHRGKNGHVREPCGPRINLAISRPETNYMRHALVPGDVIGTLVQRPIRMESKGVQLCLIKEKREEKSHTHKVATDQIGFQNKKESERHHASYKKIQEIKAESALASVEPNFRTPPYQVAIGRFLVQIC